MEEQSSFEKKISFLTYAGKKSYTALCHGKKILSPEVWEKNSNPNQIPSPLLKVKLSALSIY